MNKMGTKHRQLGYKFEHEFEEGLNLAGFERDVDYFKIPDARTMSKLTTIRSPCDFIVFDENNTYLVELKQTSSKRLPFRNIAPHQYEALKRAKIGYFIIDFKYMTKKHKILAVPGKLMLELRQRGEFSITFEELLQYPEVIELERKTAQYNPNSNEAFIDISNMKWRKIEE